MMRSIAPMWDRLRHLQRPHLFTVPGHAPTTSDQPTVGQRLAERVAAFVGSWWFLGGQAFFLFLWLIYNTLQITSHFDPPPYILLNLLLSFQAAFTGPVLLIAANVGALRDHAQSDRIEHLATQSEQLADQGAKLAERILGLEQMLEEHVKRSLDAHTAELRDMNMLVREVHSAICAPTNGSRDPSTPTAQPASPATDQPPPPRNTDTRKPPDTRRKR